MSEKKLPSHEEKQELLLTFGQVFYSKERISRRFVITEVGDENYFYAAEIGRRRGKELLHIGGTHYRENILRLSKEIWDLDRVLQAVMNLYSDTEPIGRIYDLIRDNAVKPSRVLK